MKSTRFEHRYNRLRKLIDRKLASSVGHIESQVLTEGSRYVLNAPGKRIRSTLLLLSCEAVGGRVNDAVNAAAALEMLHNFTLVHDDVMDNASSRRGRPTVHTKWNVNNAILVGDFVLGLAYRSLLKSTSTKIQQATRLFTEGFVDVCEGQALDLEFESRNNISLKEYYGMISKKTGKLISTATELGALIGNGTPRQTQALKAFGARIGRAFQIQDDLLDVVAEEKHFGKRIGGDIIEGKRTYLLVKALELARGSDKKILRQMMTRRTKPSTTASKNELVQKITSIYERVGAIDAARNQIKRETSAGLKSLRALPRSEAQEMLQWFSAMLVQRTS